MLRYLYLIYKKDGGGNPTSTVLGDIPLLIACALWLLTLGLQYSTSNPRFCTDEIFRPIIFSPCTRAL